MNSHINTKIHQSTSNEQPIALARKDQFHEARFKSNRNTLIGIVAAIALGGTIQGYDNDKKEDNTNGRTNTYIVQPGDTEWSLAEKIAPQTDPRKTIYEMDEIIPEDDLHQGHMIQPGDEVKYTSDGKVVSYEPVGSSASG